jgi:hypothetical protein
MAMLFEYTSTVSITKRRPETLASQGLELKEKEEYRDFTTKGTV